jgi:hypothetical protein
VSKLEAIKVLSEAVKCVNGTFIYVKKSRNTKNQGRVAGSVGSLGYRQLTILYQGVKYFFNASHVRWFQEYQVMPQLPLDHIDGNKDNNCISNLREVTADQNMLNRPKCKKPASSSYIGVHWNKKHKVWKSQIQYQGKYYYCGRYHSEEEAYRARLTKAKEMGIYQYLYDAR